MTEYVKYLIQDFKNRKKAIYDSELGLVAPKRFIEILKKSNGECNGEIKEERVEKSSSSTTKVVGIDPGRYYRIETKRMIRKDAKRTFKLFFDENLKVAYTDINEYKKYLENIKVEVSERR